MKLAVKGALLPALACAGLLWSVALQAADGGAESTAVAALNTRQMPAQQAPAATAIEPARSRATQSLYFKRTWGVEIVGVKPVSSGYMLSFKYRVLDPEKAKLLNDRQSKAYLVDEATGIVLAVPAMENVGELRTGAAPEADRTYFMIFGNPGKLVKSGSRVSVMVGAMHIDGLIVD